MMPILSTRNLTHLLSIFILASGIVHAQQIDVSKHDVVPGEDCTLAVRDLIKSIEGKGDVTLFFPKGQYDFYPENALEMYRAVANHDNGLKRFGFPIFDQDGITIDGNGSTFMFHGRMVPITLERSSNVTLKNFSIDWTRSFQAEMTVVKNDAAKKSFTVETDRTKNPYSIKNGSILFERYGQQDPIGSNMVFDPKTRSPIFNTNHYHVKGKRAKITEVSGNQFRFDKAVNHVPPVGSVLVAYGEHPTSRLCPAIHITNSSDVRIENVTVLAAGGMGLIVERTNNIAIDAMKVTSTPNRTTSTRADATHFIGCKGTIQVENCLFEHMLDDSINVHGAYVKVAQYLGDRRFLCEISHFQQWGLTFAEPGDKVALLSRTTLLPISETTVESVQPLNEHRFVLTVDKVPDSLPEGPLSLENLTWYPDLIMRKNIVRENRARSVLVTTKGKVLIEDNYFSSQMHGILIEGDNNKWYESGAVQDVTIRNNVFENVGFSGRPQYPLIAAPLLTDAQDIGDGRYHSNIRFEGNTIRSFNGLVAKAFSVDGLVIKDNKIEFSKDYPATDLGEAIVLEDCSNIEISGNQSTGFAKELKLNDVTQ